MKRTPPRCPYCKKRLEKVRENGNSLYIFDPAKGNYNLDDGELEPYCPHCDSDLYDVFPEGVCNYIEKKKDDP